MARNNHRATLDVTPDLLPAITALLPAGYYIAGSRNANGGVVRLVLEGEAVASDGRHMQLVVTSADNERKVSLAEAPVQPSDA